MPLALLEAADTARVAEAICGRPLCRTKAEVLSAMTGGFPLSGDACVVAGLPAAVSRNFSLDLLAEASDLESDAVVQAVNEPWRRRMARVPQRLRLLPRPASRVGVQPDHSAEALAAVRGKWATAGKRASRGGYAVTALTPGYGQWAADADDPSLDTPERVDPAATKGASTGGGAWAGAGHAVGDLVDGAGDVASDIGDAISFWN